MSRRTPVHVVWFKRDLRVNDHAPLAMAAERGAVLPLYIVEPAILRAADFDPAHWTFIQTSLIELRDALAERGQPLVVRVGPAVRVLKALQRQVTIESVWSHQETGNAITYARDIAVRQWAKTAGIPFTELPQSGVIRGLRRRDGWADHWQTFMRQRPAKPPAALEPVPLTIGRIPDHAQLRLGRDRRSGAQSGGEGQALSTLHLFLGQRAGDYLSSLSDPIASWDSCSRLSPHLAYGTISLRTVVQLTRQQINRLHRRAADSPLSPGAQQRWLRSLKAFEGRLHWRDHFMQQLETEPSIETHNLVRAFDGLRENAFDEGRFHAWCAGETGYPLVDAAMRALTATGWLNFRLRAMLVSFAAYDLWLHWERPAHHLARRFLDYEPGIHYPQMQMQSGTTGYHTLRRYDPTKQALEHDPNGTFIRTWMPELSAVPDLFIHTPWRMPPSVQREANCVIGERYPAPIVDNTAGQKAFERIYQTRQTPAAVAEAAAALARHSGPRPRRRAPTRRNPVAAQLRFDFEA